MSAGEAVSVPFDMANYRRRRARILVVDDEAIMRELLTLHLREGGYDVLVAEDVVEAGRLILLELPDLIILDVMLPEIDGFTVCETIRLQNPDIPILILSAKTFDPLLGF